MELKPLTILLDPGHGGLVDGKYVTPGKRSPFFEDGTQFYEGVNNRDNASRAMKALKEAGFTVIDIVNTQGDMSLLERCRKANQLMATHPNCLYVSIHSDAHEYQYVDKECTIRYNKKIHGLIPSKKLFRKSPAEWTEASGISVYTSKGQTKSDIAASFWIDALEEQFQNTVLWRKDTTDKDEDKEENYYVLTNTNMPAMLGEIGFHTNKNQCLRMMTEEWKDKFVRSLVKACLQYQKTL